MHQKHPAYHLCSTAYAALVQRTATCQGYCVALYRLLRETGVNCRIVTGRAGEEELHAWVIAEVDGLYYHLDPTWDAGAEEYRCFLVGKNDFADHVPAERFAVRGFSEKHPVSEQNYIA